MGIPVLQAARIGAYLLRQELSGRKRYPLVLMLEPLLRCNLACPGCGKIDYDREDLSQVCHTPPHGFPPLRPTFCIITCAFHAHPPAFVR